MGLRNNLAGIWQRVRRGLEAVWGGVVSVFSVLLVLVFWGANIFSCVSGRNSENENDANKLKIVEVNDQNERHAKLESALGAIWLGGTDAKQKPTLLIAESREIN